jgi:hypothetical protein
MDDALPVVLILGDFTHEGLTAKAQSLGVQIVSKRLRSSPRNWQKIADLIHGLVHENRLPLALAYISTPTLLDMARPEYDQVRTSLFAELQRTRTLLFVYEDNLQGIVDPFPWEVDALVEKRAMADLEPFAAGYKDDAKTFLENLHARRAAHEPEGRAEWMSANAELVGRAMALLDDWASMPSFEVLPFRKRADVTIRIFEALEDAQEGIFLRLYVPHGRYQSEQLEDFLTLFSRYLRDVEGKEFSIDVERTSRGTTYVFKGRGEASTLDDLRAATTRFDSFLALAKADQPAAERLLVEAGTSSVAEAPFIVAKYSRSLRRLELESRQEFERRKLLLGQTLEAELLDLADVAPLQIPSDVRPSSLLSVVGNAPVTVNIAGHISQNGTSIAENIVNGGIHYNAEDREILTRIELVRDEIEVLRLRSELDRLKDPAISPEVKKTAVQKLKAFVYASGRRLGKKAEDVGTSVLVAYLDSLVTGGH